MDIAYKREKTSRDGKEIGRYYKVQPTITESDRKRGTVFPVFDTPDLGGA